MNEKPPIDGENVLAWLGVLLVVGAFAAFIAWVILGALF